MNETPLDILNRVFGYPSFRGAQQAVIEQVVGGGDALVLMPTGGGKSLCYQIPALLRPGTGIVVSPLIALMQDQVDALRQLGVRAAFLNSSLAGDEQARVERALLAGELDLLLRGPGAAADRALPGPAGAGADRALRHRRGALRLPMGARLPARIHPVEPAARALAAGAADRGHGDRRCARPAGRSSAG